MKVPNKQAFTSKFFEAIYDILVEHGGTSSSTPYRKAFVGYFTSDPSSEWRFQGHLGFGAKFRSTGDHEYPFYVSREWPTHSDIKTEVILNKLNIAITALTVKATAGFYQVAVCKEAYLQGDLKFKELVDCLADLPSYVDLPEIPGLREAVDKFRQHFSK